MSGFFWYKFFSHLEKDNLMLILNVDDDFDDREMFEEAVNFIDPEIKCLQFESGLKVLEYLANAEITPDLLFIDINMPKMNGYECIEQIRQMPRYKHAPMVMYSTAFNPKLQEDFNDQTIGYLTKTPRFSELVQSIKMILLESTEPAEKLKK